MAGSRAFRIWRTPPLWMKGAFLAVIVMCVILLSFSAVDSPRTTAVSPSVLESNLPDREKDVQLMLMEIRKKVEELNEALHGSIDVTSESVKIDASQNKPPLVETSSPFTSLDCSLMELGSVTRNKPRRIYSGFLYNGEENMLRLKLLEGLGVVDVNILVESNVTFSDKAPKQAFYRDRDKRLLGPALVENVRAYVIDLTDAREIDPPHHILTKKSTTWGAQYTLRNAMLRGTFDANPDDMMIFTDVDEIIHWKTLMFLKYCESKRESPLQLSGPMFHFSFRWFRGPDQWGHPRAADFRYLWQYCDAKKSLGWSNDTVCLPIAELRIENSDRIRFSKMRDSSVHCSYCLSPEDILFKLGAISGKLKGKPTTVEEVEEFMEKGTQMYFQGKTKERLQFEEQTSPGDYLFPLTILERPDDFPLLVPRDSELYRALKKQQHLFANVRRQPTRTDGEE